MSIRATWRSWASAALFALSCRNSSAADGAVEGLVAGLMSGLLAGALAGLWGTSAGPGLGSGGVTGLVAGSARAKPAVININNSAMRRAIIIFSCGWLEPLVSFMQHVQNRTTA